MIKYLKIIFYNTLITGFLLVSMELFFKAKNSANLSYNIFTPQIELNSDFANYIPPDQAVPNEFDYKINPILEKYTSADIEQTNKYPEGYFKENKSRKKFHIVEKIKNTEIQIYSANYVYDEHEHRATRLHKIKKNNDFFVLAAGDSFTFGEGVNQGEDYPSLLSKKLGDKWNVYNLGMHGFGPNDLLFKIDGSYQSFIEPKEKSGLFIWYLIDVQFDRITCPSHLMDIPSQFFMQLKPYYDLDSNNNLILKNKNFFFFDLNRLLVTILSKSETLKYFNISYPSRHSDKTLLLFLKILNASRNKLLSGKTNTQSLIIVESRFENFDKFKELAEKLNFKVLLFYGKGLYAKREYKIHPDGHPSRKFYWLLSEGLKNYINTNFFKKN